VLTEKALEEGYLLAPGSLFSPKQLASTRMRVNVTMMSDTGVLRFLERNIGKS
jgi:DNA-binding transcriptional MocR family regulator